MDYNMSEQYLSEEEIEVSKDFSETADVFGRLEEDWFYINDDIKKLTPKMLEEIPKYSMIKFGISFDDYLTKKEGDKTVSIFSEDLKDLAFYSNFDKPLEKLPESLEILYLETRKQSYSLNILPDTLKFLNLGLIRTSRYSALRLQEKTTKLPKELEFFSLSLGELTNFELEEFPEKLKTFHFFNHELEPVFLPPLPDSLEELELNDETNHPFLNKYLPNLKTLRGGYYFNLPLDNLPPDMELISIRQLALFEEGTFNQPLCKDGKTILPENLQEFRLETNVLTYPIVDFPKKLKILHLDVNCEINIDNLAEGLEELTIMSGHHLPFSGSFDNLPSTLKKLKICYCKWDKPLDNLPGNLEKLFLLPDNYTQSVDNLPTGLKYLEVNLNGNQRIHNLPTGLEYLRVNTNSKYSQPILNLPPGLKYLNFNNQFDSEIVELPESLEWVKVGMNYTFINDLKTRYGEKVKIRPKRTNYDTVTYDSYTG